jgi:hypothetical protein
VRELTELAVWMIRVLQTIGSEITKITNTPMTILLGSIALAMLLVFSPPIFALNYSVAMFMVLIHWSSNLRGRVLRLNHSLAH